MTGTDAPPHGTGVVDVVEPDAVGAAAVDLARAAAEEEAPDLVGEHLGFDADEPRVVTHYFATLDPAYAGWRWAVTVARASRSKSATVDDVVLLPGAEAVLAPEWLPWSERLRPGDLGAGDLLPTSADDRRLVPTYFSTDDADELAISYELGLGRERTLSYDGMLDAVERWYAGDPGPRAEIARNAPASCATCGFYVPLAGAMHQAFGACANALAPDDGKVVAVDHGCGAHSEAIIVPVSPPPPPPLIDEAGYDIVDPATIKDVPVIEEPAGEESVVEPTPAAVADGSVADGSVADGSVGDGSVADGSVADPLAVAPAQSGTEAVEAEQDTAAAGPVPPGGVVPLEVVAEEDSQDDRGEDPDPDAGKDDLDLA
ncbi:MAG TPA: DUF3027 domain-containing protein [Mycobacteriales bacterium]|nr:DUF3027 domain-containing protein [Mycobacteriales bacterium]